jgi:hypothetical protein
VTAGEDDVGVGSLPNDEGVERGDDVLDREAE